MGKIDKEKHDGFVGNVGPLTVTRWKESVVVKVRQQRSDKPRSNKQKAASRRFGMLTRFVSVCNAYVSVGFRNTNKGNAQHAAIAANMETGVIGDWPDLRLNYEALQLSEGKLPSLNGIAAGYEDGRVKMQWACAEEKQSVAEEKVNVLVYNIDKEEAIVEVGVASIEEMAATILMPREWFRNKTQVVAYACVSNGEDVSRSSHLGMMEIEGCDSSSKDGSQFTGRIYRAKKTRATKRKKREEEEIGEKERRHVEGLSGVVGSVIAYDYMGIPCIKGRYKITKEPTERKRKANEKFAMLTRFLRSMYAMVKVGFLQGSSKMTQLNAALKHNYRKAFKDGEMQLAFEQIELSVGNLAGAKTSAYRNGDTMEIAWISAGGADDDKVMVGLYNELSAEGFVVLEAARREDKTIKVTLPIRWREEGKIHVYVAFVATDGETSRSEYVDCRLL